MEEILKLLGAEQPFNDSNGRLTTDGLDAYEKLISVIGHLHRIGVITETVDQCEKKFDEIIKLGF